jgi:hypothetical protein
MTPTSLMCSAALDWNSQVVKKARFSAAQTGSQARPAFDEHNATARYGDVVQTMGSRCWRADVRGGPAKMRHSAYCPEPVCWTGRHRWLSGEWVNARSCEGHADELNIARRRH